MYVRRGKLEQREEMYRESNCCEKIFLKGIRGYHIYKEVWRWWLENRWCAKNASDQYAVAVKKEGTIIGHCLERRCECVRFFCGGKVL